MTIKQNSFCEQCGAPLEAGIRFCEQCGAPVADQAEPVPVSQQPVPPPPHPQPVSPPLPPRRPVKPQKSKFSSKWKIIIVVIIIGLVVLCGLGVLILGFGWFSLSNVSLDLTNLSPPVIGASQTPVTAKLIPTTLLPPNVTPTLRTLVTIAAPSRTVSSSKSPPCPGAMPTRLIKGEHARVVNVGGYSIIFHSAPLSAAPEVGAVPEGTTVIIRDGPICAEKSYWWNVEFGEGGQSGWAMEATADGTYLLEGQP